MTDWTKSTGSTGTMMIRDTGTYVEFWLKAGPQTFNYQLPWAYVVNGVTSGWKSFRFVTGGSWQRLGRWNVTYSQTVTFKLGNTGTVGLGGPTTFSHAISRSRVPAAPTFVELTNITHNSAFILFTDGANNGASIDSRQIGYGTSETAPQKTVSFSGGFNPWGATITGLTPGVRHYFWGRTHNSRGWGPWSQRFGFNTNSVVSVNVNGVWKQAIPYVRVSGVWRQARPWVRVAGVWKETR